jgi:hypothetical protein
MYRTSHHGPREETIRVRTRGSLHFFFPFHNHFVEPLSQKKTDRFAHVGLAKKKTRFFFKTRNSNPNETSSVFFCCLLQLVPFSSQSVSLFAHTTPPFFGPPLPHGKVSHTQDPPSPSWCFNGKQRVGDHVGV